MGQQFYVIRNNPAPGTAAFEAKEERDAAKAAKHGDGAGRRAEAGDRRPRTEPDDRAAPPAAAAAQAADRAQQRKQGAGRLRAPEPSSPHAGAADPRRTQQHDANAMTEQDDETDDRPREPQRPRPRVDERADETAEAEDGRREASGRRRAREQLEDEGDIAADYLEELLDIADLDGDLDMDVEGDRAAVSIVGADLQQLVGRDGEVLEALQELTRLAVYRETGERSRLMLDISGFRAEKREELEELAEETVATGQGVRRAGVAGPDDAVRAQGRARRRGGRRPDLGVRGRRAAALRGGPARLMTDDVSRETPTSPEPHPLRRRRRGGVRVRPAARSPSGTPRCWPPTASCVA